MSESDPTIYDNQLRGAFATESMDRRLNGWIVVNKVWEVLEKGLER